MSSVVIAGNTSGSVTLAAPDVAGTTTLTLPATSGTVMVNGPAFSAYSSGGQSISNGTWTKISCSTEEFDTNSNYDATTNYRFTPTAAGYYQVNGQVNYGSVSNGETILSIYKNGSEFKRGIRTPNANTASTNRGIVVSSLIYLNGSTDYIELYTYQSSGGASSTESISPQCNYFQAAMVRSA